MYMRNSAALYCKKIKRKQLSCHLWAYNLEWDPANTSWHSAPCCLVEFSGNTGDATAWCSALGPAVGTAQHHKAADSPSRTDDLRKISFIYKRVPPPHRPRLRDQAPPHPPRHSQVPPQPCRDSLLIAMPSRPAGDTRAAGGGGANPTIDPSAAPPCSRAALRGLPAAFGRPAPPKAPRSHPCGPRPDAAPGAGDGGEAPRPPHSAPPLPASPPSAAAILGKETRAERRAPPTGRRRRRGGEERRERRWAGRMGRHVVLRGCLQYSLQAHEAWLPQPLAPGGCQVRSRCPSYPCLRGSFLTVRVLVLSRRNSPSLITTSLQSLGAGCASSRG